MIKAGEIPNEEDFSYTIVLLGTSEKGEENELLDKKIWREVYKEANSTK